MEKLAFVQKITFSLHKNQSQINLSTKRTIHYAFISKTERNQTYTAIIMSLFSLLEHSFYLLGYSLYFFRFFELYLYFVYGAILFYLLKLIGNFLILYFFNILFRNEIKKYIKI